MKRLPPTSALVALLLAATVLTGCSGGDESAEDTPSPSATSTPSVTESETASATASASATATPTPSASATTDAPPTPTPTASSSPDAPDSTAPPALDPDAAPTTYAQAAGLIDALTGPKRRVNRFASKDGNLYCILRSDFVPTSCELGQGAVRAPDVCGDDGPSQSVGRIELTDGRPTPVCNSDTIREGNARTLDVGESSSIGNLPVRCVMQVKGVTCVNDDAQTGFYLGSGRYEVF